MASIIVGRNSHAGQFFEHVENTLACAGATYAGKIAVGAAYAALSGHEYAYPANLRDYAYIGGAFYIAQAVTKYVMDKCFKETDKAAGTLSKTLIAAQLTPLALIPLNVTVLFITVFKTLPATYIGIKAADTIRDALTPAQK